MRKLITAVLATAGLFGIAAAVGLSGLIVNEAGLAYSKRFVFDLSNADVNTVSATAVYSSAAFTTSSFSTGQVSTGAVTVVSNALMTPAAASDSITVNIATGTFGESIVIPRRRDPGAYVFLSGRDWRYGPTTALTAQSIGLALQTIPWLSVSVVGNVVYATAPTGAFYNSVPVTTNRPTHLTIATPTFVGGQNAATIFINGFDFQSGRDFALGGTTSITATNLSNAINARLGLAAFVTASPSSNIVSLTSTLAGTYYNFPLTTSNSGAISVFGPALYGGLTPGWTLGGKNITAPANGFTLALPLLYSVGAGAPAIAGLTNQTTYYAIPVGADAVQLATSSAQAVLGVGAVLTSSSSLTAAKSYSLAPLPFSVGSAGFAWQVSGDGVNWSNLDTSSVTYTTPGAQNWDLGVITFRFLGLNVTAPAAGGLSLKVTAQSSFSN